MMPMYDNVHVRLGVYEHYAYLIMYIIYACKYVVYGVAFNDMIMLFFCLCSNDIQ